MIIKIKKSIDPIYTIPWHEKKDCWETPPKILKQIYTMFGSSEGYMFDPCPSNPTINGLLIDWKKYTYVNPPYSRGNQVQWVEKAIAESLKGCNVVMLLPSDTSTVLWHDLIMRHASAIYFIKSRIRFVGAPGKPKFGSVLVYFSNLKRERLKIYSLILER